MKEKDLLSSFLVGNELHDSVTFSQFSQFFPYAYRSHPEVKDLYRAYLNARHQVRSKVKRNIEIEVKRNPFHLEYHSGTRTSDDTQVGGRIDNMVQDDDLEDDLLMSEDMDIEDTDKHLTLDQAIRELALAEKIYKKEIEIMEKECSDFAQEFQDLDRELNSLDVPIEPVEGVDEQALVKDLQDLLKQCNSIMGNTSSGSSPA
ncbi:hypothetical protein BGZ51_002992 [Haplosporangium sp. Z 767]|nr:hypothetical protein BGZ51_002992 [Haplosporangium sp. Z 767]KAF9192090.1 hypothetical protein BGZ50_008820 [Haplosporangium sp. Z 11]